MKAIEKILMLNKQIENCQDLNEGQTASIECLHEAKSAFYNIQTIMREASNYWRYVHDHCKDMTENGSLNYFQPREPSEPASRQRVWKSDTFKECALQYQGQWHALRDVCAKTSKDISLVKEEINHYIRENPTKEEAVMLVKKLVIDFLHSDEVKQIKLIQKLFGFR